MAEYQQKKQTTFDFMKESAEIVEAMKLPIGEPLEWILESIDTDIKTDDQGMFKLFKSTPKDLSDAYYGAPNKFDIIHDGKKGKDWDKFRPYLNLQLILGWKLKGTRLVKKMYRNVWTRETILPDAPENESENVKFGRKFGYNRNTGDHFNFGDFLHLGMTMTCKMKEEEYNGKKRTTFDETTISTDGSGSSDSQQSIPDESDIEAMKEDVRTFAKGCKKQPEVYKKIRDSKRDDVDKLIGVAAEMFALKELKL